MLIAAVAWEGVAFWCLAGASTIGLLAAGVSCDLQDRARWRAEMDMVDLEAGEDL